LGGKYANDIYPQDIYGVQNAYSWSLNFDSTYAYAEMGTLAAYITQQTMQRALADNSSSGGYLNNLKTNATTFGLSAKQGGLLGGKVSVFSDLTYSMANSVYQTTSSASVCTTAGYCGSAPGIVNNLAIFKLGGNYQLDKNSKIGLQYWYQHLYSNDYYYNAYAFGSQVGLTGVMPTNQTSPSYNVQAISVAYTYTFD
jgi:hypothetical protein